MNLLEIKNVHASVDDKEILKGLNLGINHGEVHVIMGPNGSGKSTLSEVIIGNPVFEVTDGSIEFENEDIAELEVHERAQKGLFLSFQTPQEIPGLQVEEFLHAAKEAVTGEKIPVMKFHKDLMKMMDILHIPHNYASRSVNVGFSGGEKKKNEILQMAVLEPKLAILDETDSGLDIDATKVVFDSVATIKKQFPTMGIIIITHYTKVLEYVTPDVVHILIDGKIAKTGGTELIKEVEKNGYDKIREAVNGN